MPDIDLSYLVYDPAVGVSSTEDMTPDLLHKAIKNCLFTAFTWQPCYNSPTELAGGITVDIPVLLPGARIEICCISETTGVTCMIIRGEDTFYFQTVDKFNEPMKADSGFFPASTVMGAQTVQIRQEILRVGNAPAFTCFFRILGGE